MIDMLMCAGVALSLSVFFDLIVLVSRWEEINKDRPDILRRTKYFKKKVRIEGRWVEKEFTKVYKDEEGEWEFEESQSKWVTQSEAVNTGFI